MKGNNKNHYAKGYGETPAKHEISFANTRVFQPLLTVSKDSEGKLQLRQSVPMYPGLYRVDKDVTDQEEIKKYGLKQ